MIPLLPRLRAAALAAALPLAAVAVAGCPTGDDPPLPAPGGGSLELTISEIIPTVATVRWADGCDHADAAGVEFGTDTGYGRAVAAVPRDDGSCEAVVVGLKAAHEVHLRAFEWRDGERVVGDDLALTTPYPPNWLPTMTAVLHDADRTTDGFLLTPLLTTPPAYAILDTDGDYVWWYRGDDDYLPGLFRVAPTRDGAGVLLQLPSGGPNYQDLGDLVRLPFDGGEPSVIPGGDHSSHDFVELPDGAVAIIRSHSRQIDGQTVWGDRIVELSADGTERAVWSVWDWADADPSVLPVGELRGDWTHGNALDYDDATRQYHLSLRNVDTIVGVDRDAGELTRVIGGDHSDYLDDQGGSTLSTQQHQFEVLDDGLLVFDNGSRETMQSRAVQYRLDDDAGRAEQNWEYLPDPLLYSYALGDVTRLPSGDTLVTFSVAGAVHEVSPEGRLRWQLICELGAGFGYVQWAEALGVPAVAP